MFLYFLSSVYPKNSDLSVFKDVSLQSIGMGTNSEFSDIVNAMPNHSRITYFVHVMGIPNDFPRAFGNWGQILAEITRYDSNAAKVRLTECFYESLVAEAGYLPGVGNRGWQNLTHKSRMILQTHGDSNAQLSYGISNFEEVTIVYGYASRIMQTITIPKQRLLASVGQGAYIWLFDTNSDAHVQIEYIDDTHLKVSNSNSNNTITVYAK